MAGIIGPDEAESVGDLIEAASESASASSVSLGDGGSHARLEGGKAENGVKGRGPTKRPRELLAGRAEGDALVE